MKSYKIFFAILLVLSIQFSILKAQQPPPSLFDPSNSSGDFNPNSNNSGDAGVFDEAVGGEQGFSEVTDGLYAKTSLRQKRLIELSPTPEFDIIWSKRIWRVLDLKQKMNHTYYYPEIQSGETKNLINILMDEIITEKIQGYDPITDDFSYELTSEEVKSIGSSIDTLYITNPITQEIEKKVVKSDFNRNDVKNYRIKEDWYIDRTRSKMDVRIIGICPIIEVIDETTGEFKGNKALFWIYFPFLRKIIIRYLASSPFNDSDRKSFDDLFLKRLFDGYIYKVSNVQQKLISEIEPGILALYESQRQEEELVHMENNMWHY